MVVPVRPYRSPLEVQSDFEIKRRKLSGGAGNILPPLSQPFQPQPQSQSSQQLPNIQHNIQQHQNAPLPTYRVNSPGISFAPTVNINVQNIIKSFEDPWGEDEIHGTDMPWIYDGALKMMHDFGYAMLRDDAHDIGYLRYTARRGYRSHPSRLHHWYIGAGLMVMAQMGGIISKAREFMEAGAEFADLMPGGEGGGGLEGLGIEELESLPSQQMPPLKLYGHQTQTTQQPSLPPPPQLSSKQVPRLPEMAPSQVIEYVPSNPKSKRLSVPGVPRL